MPQFSSLFHWASYDHTGYVVVYSSEHQPRSKDAQLLTVQASLLNQNALHCFVLAVGHTNLDVKMKDEWCV